MFVFYSHRDQCEPACSGLDREAQLGGSWRPGEGPGRGAVRATPPRAWGCRRAWACRSQRQVVPRSGEGQGGLMVQARGEGWPFILLSPKATRQPRPGLP